MVAKIEKLINFEKEVQQIEDEKKKPLERHEIIEKYSELVNPIPLRLLG